MSRDIMIIIIDHHDGRRGVLNLGPRDFYAPCGAACAALCATQPRAERGSAPSARPVPLQPNRPLLRPRLRAARRREPPCAVRGGGRELRLRARHCGSVASGARPPLHRPALVRPAHAKPVAGTLTATRVTSAQVAVHRTQHLLCSRSSATACSAAGSRQRGPVTRPGRSARAGHRHAVASQARRLSARPQSLLALSAAQRCLGACGPPGADTRLCHGLHGRASRGTAAGGGHERGRRLLVCGSHAACAGPCCC